MQPTIEKHTQPSDTKVDVKNQVARMLIEAMEQGNTPWQKPWSAKSLRPTNPTTNNCYRGINRVLLGLSGRSSNLWLTYQQAADKGWQVKKGEKGTMIVKVVEFDRDGKNGNGGGGSSGELVQTGESKDRENRAFALRRYFVFNAEQIEGIPIVQEPEGKPFESVDRAESMIKAMKEQTGLMVIHGGDKACYVPSLDELRLPPKRAFQTEYDYYSTAAHEICHSTMHESRLNRGEAYAKKWGDSAYAMEELTAEIGAAILQSELGVAPSEEHAKAHLEGHASYLRSWIKAIEKDPMAIFTAAKNADKISEYVLGLERQMTAMEQHKEWLDEYEQGHSL